MKLLLIILSVLSSFFTNLEKKTLQSDFVVTMDEGPQGISHYVGDVTMKGSSFLINMNENHVAFDGKTMYMYSPETDELTLTEPTEEELLEANLFLFAKSIVKESTITEEEEKNGQQTKFVLVPNDKSLGVDQFILHIRTADLMPLLLEVKEGAQMSSIQLNNPKFLNTSPKFVIEPEETTFVNDLRF